MTACDFKEMISVVENLYYWECETDGTILDANAPEEMQKGTACTLFAECIS